jgi:TolB-like protein
VQAVIARQLSEAPRPLRYVRETDPVPIEQAVLKALAKAPADRFETANDFLRVLTAAAATTPATTVVSTPATPPQPAVIPRSVARPRWVAAAVTLGLGFLIGFGVLFSSQRRHAEGAVGASPTRLAVLPFENMGRPEDDYFADGITDEVRGKLAALPGLQVIASTSSNQYKKTAKNARQVGQELGAQYLLVGKVRWEKAAGGQSRVRVSPELVQVATASTKWQEPFEAALTDVFLVQADIAGRVAKALGVALGASDRERLAARPTADQAAYDVYLRGNEAANGFDHVLIVELRQAIGFYQRAVALDSTFALAWAQLSRSHSFAYYNGTLDPEHARGAQDAAERALALAPGLAEAHLALGDYYNFVRKDWTRALEEYDAGRKLAPNNADLLKGMALVARSQGRFEQSQALLRQAQTLDPRSIPTARRLAWILIYLRRYAEALEAAERGLALDPRAPDVHETKAMVFLAQGNLQRARAVLAAAQREVEPTILVAFVASYYDLFWALDDAHQQLILRLPPGPFNDDRLTWGLALAATYALRGNTTRARAYADSARLDAEARIRDAPNDGLLHVYLGLALAYLARKASAVREGERGGALLPIGKDAYQGAYVQHQLVRIYLLVGELEKALDQLEPLLEMPYYLSPGWLRIDPTFAPLKGNPRFGRAVEGLLSEMIGVPVVQCCEHGLRPRCCFTIPSAA